MVQRPDRRVRLQGSKFNDLAATNNDDYEDCNEQKSAAAKIDDADALNMVSARKDVSAAGTGVDPLTLLPLRAAVP